MKHVICWWACLYAGFGPRAPASRSPASTRRNKPSAASGRVQPQEQGTTHRIPRAQPSCCEEECFETTVSHLLLAFTIATIPVATAHHSYPATDNLGAICSKGRLVTVNPEFYSLQPQTLNRGREHTFELGRDSPLASHRLASARCLTPFRHRVLIR